MSIHKFIQNNCIVMQLRLGYKSFSPLNESLVHIRIIRELQKLGNVLYASSNAAAWQHTLKRSPSKIDLVISSNALGKLSAVLLNLRGFSMHKNARIQQKPAEEEPLLSLNASKVLGDLHNHVNAQWAMANHRDQSRSRELPPFIRIDPWLFGGMPAKEVMTSTNVPMSTEYNTSSDGDVRTPYFSGSRFFEFDRWQPNDRDLSSPEKTEINDYYDFVGPQPNDRSYVYLEPVIYPDYDSLPVGLKDWLGGVMEENPENWTPEETRKLDFILHGFKGFER
ncbi:LAQU0S04e03136g1_1 [Lachancea quebecensis]|uniref:LAQU0S04e03136g1_1 n=1 Tax=Lachancea quebecensis TaxID=1654605 RepID=A0A0P1KPK5_9SACH|nr:LAQU0S04e03136g1_1 [Lachancea quebecensis]